MSPTDSPGLHLEAHAAQRPELVVPLAAAEAPQHGLLERVHPLPVEPEGEADVAEGERPGGHGQERGRCRVGRVARIRSGECAAVRGEGRRPPRARARRRWRGWPPPAWRGRGSAARRASSWKRRTMGVAGFEQEHGPQPGVRQLLQVRHRVEHRRQVEPHLHEDVDEVPHVPVEDGERAEEEPQAAREERGQRDGRQEPQPGERRGAPHDHGDEGQRHEREEEVDQLGGHHRQWIDHLRYRHLADEPLVVEEAVGRAGDRDRDEGPGQEASQEEEREGRQVHPHDGLEDDGVDDHLQEGVEERPAHPQHAALVADLEVAHDQHRDELAVAPQVGDRVRDARSPAAPRLPLCVEPVQRRVDVERLLAQERGGPLDPEPGPERARREELQVGEPHRDDLPRGARSARPPARRTPPG